VWTAAPALLQFHRRRERGDGWSYERGARSSRRQERSSPAPARRRLRSTSLSAELASYGQRDRDHADRKYQITNGPFHAVTYRQFSPSSSFIKETLSRESLSGVLGDVYRDAGGRCRFGDDDRSAYGRPADHEVAGRRLGRRGAIHYG